MSDGAALIAAERQRQITEVGWTAEHDAKHRDNELIHAARAYAWAVLFEEHPQLATMPPREWPWTSGEWRSAFAVDPVRTLAKAGALLAAEIDRRIAIERIAPCPQ